MRKNALLVTQNKDELRLLPGCLQHLYNILIACNSEEMLQVIKTEPVHLVICSTDLFGAIRAAAPDTSTDFNRRLHDVICTNLHNNNLNVDLLAKSMNMSRATLYRSIKNVNGITPNTLIKRARLKRAAELLASGNYKIFEIAKMVGFNSQNSFGRLFTKQFKATPTEYQRDIDFANLGRKTFKTTD
jgi:AraC-like DNA-binding protein